MEEEWALKQALYREIAAEKGLQIEVLNREGTLLRISNHDDFFVVPFSDWPPINASSVRAIAKDKILTKELLQNVHIPVPKGDSVPLKSKDEWEATPLDSDSITSITRKLGFPVFVKPHNSSRGRGTRVCDTNEELRDALEHAANFSHIAVVEELLRGREGRLFCLDGVVHFMYYKEADAETGVANLAAGGVLVNFSETDIPEYLRDIARTIFEAFGNDLRLFAVDFFEVADGPVVVLEVNAKPFLSSICKYGKRDVAKRVLTKAIEMYFAE